MDRPSFIRCLRIAASVFFAIIALAASGLWLRTFFVTDHLTGPFVGNQCIVFTSRSSAIGFGWRDGTVSWWEKYELPPHGEGLTPTWRLLGFECFRNAQGYSRALRVPYWFIVTVACLATHRAWKLHQVRFSLGTMLIATTVLATMLGLGVWVTS